MTLLAAADAATARTTLGAAATSDLANYLPLTGGTLTGPLVATRLGNASTGDASHLQNFTSTSAAYGVFSVNSSTASAAYEHRFFRQRGGSYDLDDGDVMGALSWNTVVFQRVIANADVASGFSCGDLVWSLYNAAGTTAERMRLTAEGKLGIGANIGGTLNGMLHAVPLSASTKGVYVKGAASQSADAFHYANSSDTELFSVNAAGEVLVGTEKVIGARGAAVTDPTGGAVEDTECRAQLSALLAELRASTGHGLIAG